MASSKKTVGKFIQTAPELVPAVSNIIRLLGKYSWEDRVLYIAQECLMNKLLEIEGQSRRYREKARQSRKEAKELFPNDKKAIRNLNSKAKGFDEKSKSLQYEKWLLRYVGDGIAWYAFRHSRKHIRALSDKAPINSLGKPEKFIYHRRLFRGFRHLGKNYLPVLHDITNCLRTADLTVFERGRRFRLFEWKILGPEGKASEKDPTREKRQALRLGRLRAYFETGQIRYLHPKYGKGKHFQAELREKYHFEVISSIMRLARTETFGCENPEEGLYYAAFDASAKNEHEALIELQSKFPEAFESYFVSKRMNPFHDQDPSSLPLTAMRLQTDDILDILFGKIGLLILINFGGIERFCQRVGIPLEIEAESGRVA